MATIAARKLRTVLGNTQAVLAIELMVAAQAIEWRVAMAIGPLKSAGEKQPSLEDAEEEAHQFKEKTGPEHRETIVRELGRGTGVAYKLVREAAMPMHSDRVLDTDIRNVRRIVENGSLAEAVSKALPNGLKSVSLLRPV